MEVFPAPQLNSQFIQGLLHVRGGVSLRLVVFRRMLKSSPRPWRCFLDCAAFAKASIVFSTSVEVFLIQPFLKWAGGSLLHVRGGVSKSYLEKERYLLSSPRPWRCFSWVTILTAAYVVFSTSVEVFRPHQHRDLGGLVFSTSVEVFPPGRGIAWRKPCLLHVRGGVSTGKKTRKT